jgi:nucleotide-binding universal stress UspA family protein
MRVLPALAVKSGTSRSDFYRVVMGSVSEAVALHAKCSTMGGQVQCIILL